MSDLPQKRSSDEIKSESIKRSKKNDSPEDSGRIDNGTAEVCCHSPPNEGGESVVKQPNSDLTSKPPPPMSAEKSDPVSQPESVVKQPNSDLTSKPPSAMAETAPSAEKSDPVSQPESVVKQPNPDLTRMAETVHWNFSEPVFNPDVVTDLSKPPKPPSDLFIPVSEPWSDSDPDSGDEDYIPGLGIPPHLQFDKNRTNAYCIGCGKRTDVKHASEHNKTIISQLPRPKPFEGLFYSHRNCCKHCSPGSCMGHTLATLASSTFQD